MIEKSMLRKLILGVGVLLMLLSFSLAQDFSFSILTGTDLPSEGEYELVMGFSPEATDGYDEGIDQYAPPAPPPPAFDAAIGWDDDRYFIQILYGNGDLSEHVFGVQLQYGENNVINITWDNTGWAALMDSVKLQDAFGGVMINVNMLEETELELTNPAFNLLQLKVYPKNASQNPTADFILDPLEGFAPLSVNFTDQSEPGMGTISLWNWDFGDGGSSIEQNPTHIFTNIGEWTVKLIAENSYGFSDSTTAVVTVNQPYPPNVDFTSDVTEGDMPLTVQFTDISVEGDGELLSWAWNFGDGGSSTEQNPLYVYEESGDFTVSLMVTDEYTLSMTETKENYISVFESLPPIADAGEDQIVTEKRLVALDGSASISVSGDPLTYTWTAPEGIELSDSSLVNPTFVAPDVDESTIYQFSLMVYDGSFYSEQPDTVNIEVGNDFLPIANAGEDQAVYERENVELDGTGSIDEGGEQIFYHWTSPELITLSDTAAVQPTFTAPSVSDTIYLTFLLTVRDEFNDSTDSLEVTVLPILPLAVVGELDTTVERTQVQLDGSGSSSSESDNHYYQWISPASIELSDSTAENPYFIAPITGIITNYQIILFVSDGVVNSIPDTVSLTVLPKSVANAGVDQVVVENTVVELNGSGSYDLNNDDLTYNWAAPAPIVLTDTIPLFPTFTAPATGDSTTYAISLSVYDGSVSSEPDTVLITVVPNTRPNADAGDDFEINQAVSTNLSGSGYDSTDVSELYGDLTYLWVTPSEIVLDDSTKAEPSFIAPVVNDTLSFLCVLTVNDGEYLSAPDTVEITVIGNQAPVAHAGDDMSVAEGSTVTLNGLNSTDINGDTLSFLWYASEGISLSDSSISNPTFETPVTGEVTAYSFTLIVNDGQLDSEPDTVIITSHVNTAPIATAGTDQVVDQGTEVMLVGMSSDDFSIPAEILYTWTTPPEIALTNRYKQVTEFTAPDADEDVSYPCVLVVNDGTLDSEPDTVIVTVLKNKPPIVDAGENQIVEQGTIVQLDGTGSSDPNNDDLIFSWSYFAGPDGVEVVLSDDSDSQPTFIAPDREQISFYTFLLVVNDGEYDSESPHVRHDSPAKIVITVNENKKPIANAGAFKKTIKGGAIFVNGAQSSDINNDSISFVWSCDDETLFIDEPTATKPIITFPDNIVEETDYAVVLTVTDAHGLVSDPDTVTVTATVEGLKPPTPPNVFARVEHQKVVLTWDGISEDSKDPMTEYSDFEGYKVYKSLNGGNTWGTVIYDTYYDMDPTVPRDTVGWVPIAQFDLDEEQDRLHCLYENEYSCDEETSRGINIIGLDPLRTEISLGTNSGLTYSFIDTNVIDGVEYTYAVTAYDMGLPTYKIQYVDEEGDGTYREVEIWSPTNPEHYIANMEEEPHWGANKSLECSKTDSSNFVTVIPGYYATNISFPDLDSIETFIVSNENNIGSGDRLFELVDVNALTTAMMRLEIEASPRPGSFEGASTDNPKLYVYEITDSMFQEPASWVDVGSVSTLEAVITDSLLSLPGAKNSEGIIYLPEYKLEAFPIMSQYDVGYQSNWTDFFDGVRLRFDNNINDWYKLEEITNLTNEAFIDSYESNIDSSFVDILDIRLEYSSQEKFDNRPLYEYKIEFSTSVLDTARLVSPSGGCDDLPFDGTLLPFRITNITTGNKVDIIHLDKGTTGEDEDAGNKDCMWERNEKLGMKWEDVIVGGEIDTIPYIYDLFIDFKYFDFFTKNVPIWSENQSYEKDMPVKYANMIWVASEYIPTGEFAPNTWLDDGNGGNMNPWTPDYGWKDGDYIILKPERWFVDGDSWVADLSRLGKPEEVTQEQIEEVTVVPNPYIVHSEFNETADSRLLQFIHLPQDCRITIYTITGEVVTSFEHHDEYFSYEFWDLRTDNNQEIAPGLYIFRVESDSGKEFLGKFAVVR